MKFICEHFVSEMHPSLEGHFPGNPVVPGVIVLDLVFQTVKSWQPRINIDGLPSVKFLRPTLPGMYFTIELEHSTPNRISFSCYGGNELLSKGSIALRRESVPT